MNKHGILDDIDQKIIKLRGRVPTRDMADILGIPEGTTLKRVRSLIHAGYLAAYSSSTQPRAGKQAMTPRTCLGVLCMGQKSFMSRDPVETNRICRACRSAS